MSTQNGHTSNNQATKNGKTNSQGAKPNKTESPSEINSQKQIAQKESDGCSFIAGTLVATPLGFREIQNLKIGDLVRAKNDQTGEVEDKKINAVFGELHKEVIELTIKLPNGKAELITTTAEHPFMLYDGDWLPASELEVGAFVETLAGLKAEVVGFEIIKKQQTAYNFEVDEFHTYAVGEGEFWVHNFCKGTETIVRRTNAEEADLMKEANGLVPGKEPHQNKPKWVTIDNKQGQKGLPSKGHEKTVTMTVEKGTKEKYSKMGVDIETVDWKENALPDGILIKTNEKGALGIGKNLINEFNKNVIKVDVK